MHRPRRRSGGLGADPLEGIATPAPAPAPAAATPPAASGARGARARDAEPSATASRTQRATFHVDADLLERARRTVVHLAAPPEMLTMSALVENALAAELARLERKHHGGQPFPPVPAGVRRGRPPGS